MAKLLRADLRRYFTTVWIYVSAAAVVGLTVFNHIQNIGYLRSVRSEYGPTGFPLSLGNYALFGTVLPVDAVFSILCTAIFLLRELNGIAAIFKLTRGATRRAVYVSAASACCCGAVVLRLVSILTESLLLALTEPGIGLLYFSETGDCLLSLFCTITSAAAFTAAAVFLFFSLPRVNIYLLCISLLFACTLYYRSADRVVDALNEPEYVAATELDGEADAELLTKNPEYVAGLRRIAFILFADAVPLGQDLQFAKEPVHPPERAAVFPFINAATIVLYSAAGIFLFKRLDFH